MHKQILTALLFALVGLAGCLGDDDGSEGDEGPAGQDDSPWSERPPVIDEESLGELEFVFDSLDLEGNFRGQTAWRIAMGTGNCCENYVTATPEGRILDFGGTLVKYSDDEGRTWTTVPALFPYQNGEGAIIPAPGGDVVGIGWDPYSGDNVYGVKFENDTGDWEWFPTKLHTPFWDREWIVALPGPFTNALGEEFEYVTLARGGVGTKEVLLLSTDGVQYTQNSLPDSARANGVTTFAGIDAEPDWERDWIQPLRQTTISPVGDGYGLQTRILPNPLGQEGDAPCRPIFGPDMVWRCLELTEASLPGGPLLVDSVGSLHVISTSAESFDYHISHDGGRSWNVTTWEMPLSMRINDWDFKAHRAIGQTVVAIHAATENNTGQDLAFRFTNIHDVPKFEEILLVGNGEAEVGGGGVSNQGDRFDFMNMAFLPDGRIVMSMQDTRFSSSGAVVSSNQGSSISPVLAIELP